MCHSLKRALLGVFILYLFHGINKIGLSPTTSGVSANHVTHVKLGFIPTLSQNRRRLRLKSKHYSGALLHSLYDVNSNPWILPWTTLSYVYNDTRGDTYEAIRAMKWQANFGALAFIGPEESCVMEATIASAWNIPLLAYVSQTLKFLPSITRN